MRAVGVARPTASFQWRPSPHVPTLAEQYIPSSRAFRVRLIDVVHTSLCLPTPEPQLIGESHAYDSSATFTEDGVCACPQPSPHSTRYVPPTFCNVWRLLTKHGKVAPTTSRSAMFASLRGSLVEASQTGSRFPPIDRCLELCPLPGTLMA